MKHNKIKIIANPHSGSLNKAELDEAVAYLRRFLPAEVVFTHSLKEALDVMREISAESGVLPVICGGDGTLNAYLNNAELGNYFGLIPRGTANVVARELGVPLNYMGAAKTLLTGAVQEVDLGVCNGKRFLFSAGLGFDAMAAHNVSRGLKRLCGQYAYYLSGVKTFLNYRRPRFEVYVDEGKEAVLGEFVLVSNMRRYGGELFFALDARYDDGLLDLVVLKTLDLSSALSLLQYGKTGKRPELTDGMEEKFCVLRGKKFRIVPTEPQRFQLDGEVFEPAEEFVVEVDLERAKIITP